MDQTLFLIPFKQGLRGCKTISKGDKCLALLRLLLPSAEDMPLSFLLAETLVRMKEVMGSLRHPFCKSSRRGSKSRRAKGSTSAYRF